ncbi:MAG: DUF4091 domain-containing protein [Victivallaceae bacterium]|nr:DUF4091 domain-containing protein [Victivallaceae bacterium]
MQKCLYVVLCVLIAEILPLTGADWIIQRDGWRVSVGTSGFAIQKDGMKISSGSNTSLVKGPGWKSLLDTATFAEAIRSGTVVKTDRSLTVTESKGTSCAVTKVEILGPDQLQLSYAPSTDAEKIADSSFWFLGLPQEDFAFGQARFGKNKQVTLPCPAKEDPVRKSRWRLTPDTRKMTISGKNYELTVEGAYFHLFDARFHGYFLPPLQTFCLVTQRVPNHGKAVVTLRVRPLAKLIPTSSPAKTASAYLELENGALLSLNPTGNTLCFPMPKGAKRIALTVTTADGKERSYAGGADGKISFDLRAEDRFLKAVVPDRGAGGPFPIHPNRTMMMRAQAKRMIASLSGRFSPEILRNLTSKSESLFSGENLHPATRKELSERDDREAAFLRQLSCYSAASGTREDLDAVLLSSTERLIPGENFPAKTRPLKMLGAGGQTLYFQAAILPLSMKGQAIALESVSIDGIAPEQMEVFEVLPVVVGTRQYPDMLEPKRSFALKEEVLNLFFAVKLPNRATPGTHTLKVTFAPEKGTPLVISGALKILPFDLPDVPAHLTAGGVKIDAFRRILPGAGEAGFQELLRYISRRKVTVHRSMLHPRELDGFDWGIRPEQWATYERGGFLNLGNLPWLEWLEKFYFKTQKNAKFKSSAAYYQMASGKISANAAAARLHQGNLQNVYFYYDELGTGQDQVVQVLADLKKQTSVKLMTCFDKPHFGEKYVDFYRALPDWMVFCANYFKDRKFDDYFAKLRQEGKRLGWYFNSSNPPFGTFNAVSCPAVRQKAIYCYMLRHKIDCNLMWGLNAWLGDFGGKNPIPYQLKTDGNGFLFYPGRDRKEFASSLRFELLAEGIEYLQYFELLEAKIKQAKQRDIAPDLVAEGEKLLQMETLPPIWQEGITSDLLDRYQNHAANLIEALNERMK